MIYTGHEAPIIGMITLLLTLGKWPKTSTEMVDILIMDLPSAYNVIIGRVFQSQISFIPSVRHLLIKFPIEKYIGIVCGDQLTLRNCYYAQVKNKGQLSTQPTDDHDTLPKE